MMQNKVLHGEILMPKLRPPSQPPARLPMGNLPAGYTPPDPWRRMVPSGSAGGPARVPNVAGLSQPRWAGAAGGGWMKDPRSLALRAALQILTAVAEDQFMEAWYKRTGGLWNPGPDWDLCYDCGGNATHVASTANSPICGPPVCGERSSLAEQPIGSYTPSPDVVSYTTAARAPSQLWRNVAVFKRTRPWTSYPRLPAQQGPLVAPLPYSPPSSEPEVAPEEKGLPEAIEDATGVSVDEDGKVAGRPSRRVAVDLGPITFVPDWASGTVIIASPKPGSNAPPVRTVPPPKVVIHEKAPDFKKKSVPLRAVTALKVYHALTEASDAVDVLADAIAGKPCKKLPGVRKAACVLNNFSGIDWTKAIPGLIYDQLEDRVVAYLHQFGARQGYGPNVTQMTQFARQLKALRADALSQMPPGAAEKAIKDFLGAELPAAPVEHMRSY